ncbi:MAG: energy transducer TonB [Sulfuritalea sp.]|nr:energy transducer TonB [Sulfuritalea sp.]
MSNRPLARLAWPLGISLALHLCIVVLFPSGAASSLRSNKAVTLTVLLPSKERPDPPPIAATSPLPAVPEATAAPELAAAPDAVGNLTQKARFLAPPDLSVLETIPVTISGSLTLRLNVSPLGTVDRVTVINSDPVPKELRDGLVARFQEARLTPALAGSKAVASSLDVVIHFEAAPELLPRQP